MDPRDIEATGPKLKRANHSRLMAALQKASLGEKVVFCPYGCTPDDTDEMGLCRHVVGYTTDGKFMEPLVTVKGRRVVQVPVETGPDGRERRKLVPVPPGAHLERITVSSRVYSEQRSLRDAAKGDSKDGR